MASIFIDYVCLFDSFSCPFECRRNCLNCSTYRAKARFSGHLGIEKPQSKIISLVTYFLDLLLLILCWFFKRNADLGTPSKSSGRPNRTKSPKWRQQYEINNLWTKQKEAPESNLRSRSPFATSLIDLDSILASFWSLQSHFLAQRDGIDHLVIATSKVQELVSPPFEHAICSLIHSKFVFCRNLFKFIDAYVYTYIYINIYISAYTYIYEYIYIYIQT